MIKVENLIKTFGDFTAVDNISFAVEKGEVLGFLGPNGAGKSTTMRMLTCFLKPTSGTAKINGFDIIDDSVKVRSQIGYLPENAPVYSDMTVAGYLDFIAEMRGLSGKHKKIAVEQAIETCFLQNVRFQSVDTLSKGYKQRTCFAQAVLHDPPILILDEPTDGLDPNQKYEVRQMISRISAQKCIIISTHILEEVEAICSRAIIIANGKIVANGSPDTLKAKSANYGSVIISVAELKPKVAVDKLSAIFNVAAVDLISSNKNFVKMRAIPRDNCNIVDELSQLVRDENWKINQFNVENGRLDEVFRDITSINS